MFSTIALLDPKGPIALHERDLMLTAVMLMLLVVIPVFVLTFAIAWRYRAGNTHAKYTPNWEHNTFEEFVWWTIPCIIVFILARITWTSSHELDPYVPLVSDASPITIQVVALDWKWLFIYPQQGIATINQIQFPVNTPVDFEITADAPMNSFWIPQLGGQIYAMPGMNTKLHLMATEIGTYSGSSANFSGGGFSGMTFTAHAVSNDEFSTWVTSIQSGTKRLDRTTYEALVLPSSDVPVSVYASVDESLYNAIIMKYQPQVHATRPPSPAVQAMDMHN